MIAAHQNCCLLCNLLNVRLCHNRNLTRRALGTRWWGYRNSHNRFCNDLCENDKVMEKETNKTKWLHVRLSQDEYVAIHKRFKGTTCRKLSGYIRKKLLDKHLTTYYRNKSLDDFMTGLMQLKSALNHLGNNFNQAVRRLNMMPVKADASGWIGTYEQDRKQVMEIVEQIDEHLEKFSDEWLRDLKQERP